MEGLKARACLDLEACTAKRIIDVRLALEARRTIVDRDETIDAIAFVMRFRDAGNLIQTFSRMTGATPSGSRQIWCRT